MGRSRTPSLGKRIAGLLLTSTVALFCVAAVSISGGCSSAETTPAPDEGPPPCEEGPFLFGCDPIPEEQAGCNTADGVAPLLSRVAPARYPLGCVIQSVGPRDPQGDCRLDALCKCVYGELPGPTDAGDAGADDAGAGDAGDAGDAGADDAGADADDAGADADSPAPQPAPAPRAMGPVWQCHP